MGLKCTIDKLSLLVRDCSLTIHLIGVSDEKFLEYLTSNVDTIIYKPCIKSGTK